MLRRSSTRFTCTADHAPPEHLQQGIESDHFRVKKNMPRVGGFQSFATARDAVRDREVERVLEENDIENLVDEAMEDVVIPAGADLVETVRQDLQAEPAKSWRTQVDRRARQAAA